MNRSDSPPIEGAEPPKTMVKFVNPVMRRLLRSPLHRLVSDNLTLLGLTGRRTGRTYTLPVGYHYVEGMLTVLTGSRWRYNLRGGAPVEVTLKGRRRHGHAELSEDPDEVARVHKLLLDRMGLEKARRLGLVVKERREPTHDELKRALSGKAVVRVQLDRAGS